MPARTVCRVLHRAGVPYLRHLDPMTGQEIRSSKATATRYERSRPGELVHVDVKKLGKIPDGGGWRAHGRAAGNRDRTKRIGYDYVHSMVDDHTRLAYSEIHDDETATTCAAFLRRAAAYFAAMGITRLERVIPEGRFRRSSGSRFVATYHVVAELPKYGLGTVHVLPPAPLGATDQMSPTPAAAPAALAGSLVVALARNGSPNVGAAISAAVAAATRYVRDATVDGNMQGLASWKLGRTRLLMMDDGFSDYGATDQTTEQLEARG